MCVLYSRSQQDTHKSNESSTNQTHAQTRPETSVARLCGLGTATTTTGRVDGAIDCVVCEDASAFINCVGCGGEGSISSRYNN